MLTFYIEESNLQSGLPTKTPQGLLKGVGIGTEEQIVHQAIQQPIISSVKVCQFQSWRHGVRKKKEELIIQARVMGQACIA